MNNHVPPEKRLAFHLYNRSTDRRDLFIEHENFIVFIQKMHRQLAPVADILAYCVMPNHFHVSLSPKHEVLIELPTEDVELQRLPTDELSEAVKRWLMGFTKSYNKHFNMTGSRFCQHTRCKQHRSVIDGINYIHDNPERANLVSHPGEWGYSSWAEHNGFVPDGEAICNLALVRKLTNSL